MNILAVHQGNELYGSDRSFLSSIQALRSLVDDNNGTLTVRLPSEGPLSSKLKPIVDTLHHGDLAVLRRGQVGSLLKQLPSAILAAKRAIDAADVVYINTTVITDYLLASRFSKTPAICHVREVPPPGKSGAVLRQLVNVSKTSLIYNSAATKAAFNLSPRRRQDVLHNGVTLSKSVTPLQQENIPVNILMIGRFNAWKGQDVLVEAIARLAAPRAVRVKIVGGVYEHQYHFRSDIQQRIDHYKLGKIIRLKPFTNNTVEAYNWADIVIVPSKKPEPFGRVAIEAMAAGRPVIAANHGGLTEIVVDGVTGILCPPDHPTALADSIEQLLTIPALRAQYGHAGYQRYLEKFTETQYQQRLQTIFREILA